MFVISGDARGFTFCVDNAAEPEVDEIGKNGQILNYLTRIYDSMLFLAGLKKIDDNLQKLLIAEKICSNGYPAMRFLPPWKISSGFGITSGILSTTPLATSTADLPISFKSNESALE